MLDVLVAISSLGAAASLATGGVKIVGMPGGRTQTLPDTYIKAFPRWFVDWTDDERGRGSGDDDGGEESTTHPRRSLSISRLPTAGDETFVDPTSTSELWWPSDLDAVQVRPALDVLLKGGTPNYALAGLNVRVPRKASSDGKSWRNYGLNSQPLASQWTAFGISVEGSFRVECFVGRDSENDEIADDIRKNSDNSQERKLRWKRLFPGSLGSFDDTPSAHAMFGTERMKKVIEVLGIFLSGIDSDSPLSDGFHVVSFPLATDWINLPKVEDGEGKPGYKITCVATAEPDAKALLEMDRSLLEMTATSLLEVDVSETSAGSDSNYLPDSYKPLYVAS
uniref:Uncharacterized protein n=1 Tax=Pseudictyota dubia TaxID=2749911 RepID=A0A7R9W4N0_9STRA